MIANILLRLISSGEVTFRLFILIILFCGSVIMFADWPVWPSRKIWENYIWRRRWFWRRCRVGKCKTLWSVFAAKLTLFSVDNYRLNYLLHVCVCYRRLLYVIVFCRRLLASMLDLPYTHVCNLMYVLMRVGLCVWMRKYLCHARMYFVFVFLMYLCLSKYSPLCPPPWVPLWMPLASSSVWLSIGWDNNIIGCVISRVRNVIVRSCFANARQNRLGHIIPEFLKWLLFQSNKGSDQQSGGGGFLLDSAMPLALLDSYCYSTSKIIWAAIMSAV